ncbi:vitellogenin receptor-like [Planococcus citri]|uniref:vitellogenin receptor-like n=1 Tax=Planococcus citri TaxID=170843 RepID=UPI0031F767E0
MCEKIIIEFLPKSWRSSVSMRLLMLCLFYVVNAESVKKLPRFNLPGEDGQITENSPIKSVDCSVNNGQFLCEDEQRCIDFYHTCDDECDCSDCSDESVLCWEYDEILCRSCDHLCFPSPHGSMCLQDNNTSEFSPLLVLVLQECDPADTLCDQKCVMYEGTERCSCTENYRAKPGTKGQECISDVSCENLLLYSTDNEIKLFNFTANEARVIRKNVKCQGLAAAGDYFYYGTTDDNNKAHVHKVSMMTGGETDLIIDTCNGSTKIYDIDIDWVTGNIYFSTDRCVGVCSREEEFCTRVSPTLSQVDVCHIGLAPRSGLLFTSVGTVWHHYSDARILKSSMDGSNQILFYEHRGKILHPISLTVDELSEKVFWIDPDLGEIDCIQFDGKNWRRIFQSRQLHVFAISEFENNLFWTEENKNIIGMHLKNTTDLIIDQNATSVKYLYAFNPVLQHNKISNPCTNSACKGLCLLRPSSDKGFLNFTCLCDNVTSSSRKQWCNNPFIPPSQTEGGFEKDFKEDIRPSQPEGTIKKDSNDEIPMILVLIFGCLIVLTSFAVYFVFRRKGFCKNDELVYSQMLNRPTTEYEDTEL